MTINLEAEERIITMDDLPKEHYLPTVDESLNDCPYIKRYYKFTRENKEETLKTIEGTCPAIGDLKKRNPPLDFIIPGYE